MILRLEEIYKYMPIIKSAKKRVRVARRATVLNARTKRNIRNALKTFRVTIETNKKDPEALKKLQSALDTAAKKKVMSKKKVARKQRQLAAQAKAAGVPNTAKKTPSSAKKSTTTKTTTKPKVPATKKPTTKKSAKK